MVHKMVFNGKNRLIAVDIRLKMYNDVKLFCAYIDAKVMLGLLFLLNIAKYCVKRHLILTYIQYWVLMFQ